MNGYDARVRLCGDNRKASILLDSGVQECTDTKQTQAALTEDGLAGLLADDFLGGVALKKAHTDTRQQPLYGLGPHAASATAKLLEGGLDTGVKDGARLAIERKSPLELSDPEATRTVWHEEWAVEPG